MREDILQLQQDLQARAYGFDILNFTEDQLIEYVTWNAYALLDEMHEAMKEVSWKPWQSKTYLNRDEFLAELIDLAHFFNNMWLAVSKLQPTEAESLFTAMYRAKHVVNARRQELGYDGVTGKCPACHRDLEETELIMLSDSDGADLMACSCGRVLREEAGE